MFCTWMNSEFGLDELINLRARVGDLEVKLLKTLKVKFKQKFNVKEANEIRHLRKKVASLENQPQVPKHPVKKRRPVKYVFDGLKVSREQRQPRPKKFVFGK